MSDVPEILTMCVVHFTTHWNSLEWPRKSNHSVVHFVKFSEIEIVSNHTCGWNTDDVRVPTIHVVDLYIISTMCMVKWPRTLIFLLLKFTTPKILIYRPVL